MKQPVIAILTLLIIPLMAHSATIQLPQTGQLSCYDSLGQKADCSGSGQDGDKRAGVAWPAPRFHDNGDGTVSDSLTGLVWMKNASCFGLQDWPGALSSAATLSSGTCSLTDGSAPGDWRLPNIVELESLVDSGSDLPAVAESALFGGTLKNYYYWSSSTYADFTAAAWIVDMSDGYVSGFGNKTDKYRTWLVRDQYAGAANAATVQLPRSGQNSCWDGSGNALLSCSSSGQDGDTLRGVAWPEPRFSDNGNGTVSDNLTGLVWLKNAGCFGAVSWQSALDGVNNLSGNGSACGLLDASQAGDWRLPNRREMQSLFDRQQLSPALPVGHELFNGVVFSAELNYYYWSSTSVENSRDEACIFDIYDGYMLYDQKNGLQNVWPVRNTRPNRPPLIAEGESVPVIISKNGVPSAFSLVLHASDPDRDSLSWSIGQPPTQGSANLGAGSDSVNVSYVPATGYVGQDSFIVQVDDGKGGMDAITVNVTVNQTYTVKTSVNGSGTLTPATWQIFNGGSIFTFSVLPDANYFINSVSGCGGALSGNSYPIAAVSSDCTVSADFQPTLVKVPENPLRTDYSLLQDAYDNSATASGMTILAQEAVFGSLTLDRNIDIAIKGGYQPGFTVRASSMKVLGPLVIKHGSLTVENMVIM